MKRLTIALALIATLVATVSAHKQKRIDNSGPDVVPASPIVEFREDIVYYALAWADTFGCDPRTPQARASLRRVMSSLCERDLSDDMKFKEGAR